MNIIQGSCLEAHSWSSYCFFSRTLWLWSSSSWPKSQSCGLLLHGFFQSSQSCGLFLPSFFPKLHGYGLFLPSRNLKVVVLFFMGFFKAPKAIFSSWLYPQSPDLFLLGFFQSSQSCCLLHHVFFQSSQSSQSYVLLILGFFLKLHGCGLFLLG